MPPRLSLNSKINTRGLCRIKQGYLITEGEYEGWTAYGPYTHKKAGRASSVWITYYQLVKGDKHKTLQVHLADFTIPEKNTKPFIDWITWKNSDADLQ